MYRKAIFDEIRDVIFPGCWSMNDELRWTMDERRQWTYEIVKAWKILMTRYKLGIGQRELYLLIGMNNIKFWNLSNPNYSW